MDRGKLFTKECCLILTFLVIWALVGCQNQQHGGKKEQDSENGQIEQQVSPEPARESRRVPEKVVVTEVPDYTYQKLAAHVQQLKEGYPAIAVTTIGESVMGRELFCLKLGTGPLKINVVGGVHGREGITSLLVLKLLEDYARQAALGQRIGVYKPAVLLQQVQFSFVPMLNPDGVEIAVKGVGVFGRQSFYLEANDGSGDFSRWKANANGVDLNKQFKADWQQENSVGKPYYQDYKGLAPESEPESKALADYTRSGDFAAVVVFHNSGSVIFWYYKQKGEQYGRDLDLAKRLQAINGYDLIAPEESDLGAGGYKDWFIDEFGRPGFTIEVGRGSADEPLPSALLDRYFAENRAVLLELATVLVEEAR